VAGPGGPHLATDPGFFRLLTASHLRLVGTPLAGPDADARWLYEDAPFGVLAHDGTADPTFVYANRTVQRCFEYGWEEFTALRSRLSAEPDRRAERDRVLTAVRRHGAATGYRGLRVAASGRRFWIEDTTIWNLVDDDGVRVGQAAVFRNWTAAENV
jgi:hypothetical protein